MAAILSTVDVEDLGTEKIRAYKDALTDLLDVQQKFAQGSGLGGAAQSAVAMLGSVSSATQALAHDYASLADVQAQVAASAPQVAQVLSTVSTASQGTAASIGETAASIQTLNSAIGQFAAYGRAYAETAGLGSQATQSFKDSLGELIAGTASLKDFTDADRKALSDLNDQIKVGAEVTPHQTAEVARLASAMQAALTPTDAMAASAVDAAAGFKEIAQRTTEAVAPAQAAGNAIEVLVGHVAEARDAVLASEQPIQLYLAGLTSLAAAAGVGGVPLEAMAAAAAQLAQAARDGTPGLTENADALDAITKQLQAGIPLTAEQATQLQEMAVQLGAANTEALGLSSAIEGLAAEQQKATAEIRETYNALTILSEKLKEGATVTRLQADALQELAARAKEGNGFTTEQAASAQALADKLKVGATVTREAAEQIKHLTEGYAEANKETLGLKNSTEENIGVFERFKVGALAVAAVLVELGREALNYAKEAAQGAARTEVLGTVMLTISKNAHISSVEMQTQVERIKALGITTQEATDAVIKFVQAQLRVADAAKLARVAQDLAVVAGVNSSQAFERLTHAIESQSAIMLRQFGIVTGLHEIYGAYATQVGKTVKELDAADKKQAFLNKVLEEGAKFAGTYEAAMGNVGKQFTSLDRLWEEVSDAVGKGLLPVFQLYVTVVTTLTTMFLALPAPVQAATSALLAFLAALAAIGGVLAAGQLLGVGELFVKIAGQAKLAAAAFTAVRETAVVTTVALEGVAVATGEVTAAGSVFAAAWAGVVAFFGSPIIAGIVAFTVAIAAAGAALSLFGGKGAESVDHLRESFAEIEKKVAPINELTASVKKLREEVIAGAKDTGGGLFGQLQQDKVTAYAKAVDQLQSKLEGAGVGFIKTGATADTMAEAIKKLTEETDKEKALLVGQMKDALATTTAAYKEHQQQVEGVRQEIKILEEAQGDQVKALELTRRALDENKNAIMGQTSVWRDLWTLIKNSVIITWELAKKTVIDLWNVMSDFASWLASGFIPTLKAIATAAGIAFPALQPFIEVMTKILDKLPNVRDALHSAAVASQVTADQMGGGVKALTEHLMALQKAGTATKTELDQLARLIRETDPSQALANRAKLLEDARKDTRDALFGGLTPADQKKKADEILKVANDLWGQILTGQKKVKEATGKIKLVDIDPAEIPKILSEIEAKLTKASDAAAKEAEKYKKALDQFLGVDPEQQRKLQALNAALAATKNNHEAYLAVIARGKGEIEKFNLLTDAQKAKLGGLGEVATAAAFLVAKAADAIASHWEKANRAVEAAADEAARQNLVKASDDLAKTQIANAEKMRDATIKANDAIRKDAQALQDEIAQQTLSGVDLQVYQLHRRGQEFVRAAEEERRVRQQEVDDSRKATELKIEQYHRELAEFYNTLIRKRELEVADYAARVQDAKDNGTRVEVAAAEAQLAGAQRGLEILRQSLLDKQALADQAQMKIDEGLRHEVDLQQENADKITGARRRLTDAQIAETKRLIADLTGQWSRYRQVAIQALMGVVDAFLSGFEKMISGAGTFKDLLIGVWQSIKSSLLNLMADMVKGWLASLLKMKAASDATKLLPNLAGGLPGTGLPTPEAPGGTPGGGVPRVPTQPLANMTVLQGILLSGTASLLGASIADKVLSKWIDGSTAKGVAVGAGAGAASGAGAGAAIGAFGGPLGAGAGALIGLGVGAIKGWFDARKMREEMKANREEIIKNLGGLDEFKQKAEEAGFAYEKFLNTKKPSEFGSELGKLKEALDALDLKKAKESLPQVYSQIMALGKAAASVGFDINKLYNTKNVAEFNKEQEKLNKLLEDQKARMTGLTTAVAGLQSRLTGEILTIAKAFKDIFPKQEDIDDFFKRFKEARDKGFTGNAADFAKDIGLSAEQIAKIAAQVEKSQASFERLGRQAQITFAGILSETGDIVQALNAVSPSLDLLQGMIDTLGLSAKDAGLANLLLLRRIIQENEDVANSLTGIVAMINGLADANRLTQASFNDLGTDAVAQFQILKDRGVGLDQIMLLMQPTLQALYDAQKKFGLAVDESTQKLIDQGVQAGIVGDQFQSIQQKTLDILVIIAEQLGAKIPAAYQAAAAAATTAGADQAAAAQRAKGEIDAQGKAVDRTSQAYKDAEAAATAAASQQQTAAAATITVEEAHRKQQEAVAAGYTLSGGAATLSSAEQIKASEDAKVALDLQRNALEHLGGGYNGVAGAAAAAAGTILSKIPEGTGTIVIQRAELEKLITQWMAQQKAAEQASAAAGAGVTDTTGKIGRAKDEVTKWMNEWVRAGAVIRDKNGDIITGIGGVTGAFGGLTRQIETVTDRLEDATAAAATFGQTAEDAATGAAEGHSPTGMKQLIYRIREAADLYRTFRDDVVDQSKDMELAAARSGPSLANTSTGGGAHQVTVHVNATNTYTVNGTKATARDQWNELRPEVERDMEANTGQYAAKIAKGAGRYMRAK